MVAGVRTADGKRSLTRARCFARRAAALAAAPRAGGNTTIAIVATNARLTKAEMNRVALMADDGLARAMNPSHTTGDGDTVFALATGRGRDRQTSRRSARSRPTRWPKPSSAPLSRPQRSAASLSARDLGTVPARFK